MRCFSEKFLYLCVGNANINFIRTYRIMTEDIRYQMNGQLVDNTVNVDNKEDMYLAPVRSGSADEAQVIAAMKAEDSGLREETIRHVHELEKRVIKRMLMSGMNVNNGLFYASAYFRGVVEDAKWNREKNSIVVRFKMGADLREAVKKTAVNIIGEKGSTMYIGGVTDVSTRAQDASATAGRPFTLKGGKLKIVGTDESVGITLTDSEGIVTRITEDLYVANGSTKVTFIIPNGLADGVYTMTLTTQYANAVTLLKTPRSVNKTIRIGQVPSGGSEGENEGGALDEHPF